MEKILTFQYELIRDARKALFNYCGSLSEEHLSKEIENFGRGSIRNLLVHNESCYEYWLGEFALQKNFSYTNAENIKSIDDVRAIFEKADLLMIEFLETFRDKYEILLTRTIRNSERTASPFKIFTHVTTHEFHHKGQILSMSRLLGYIPVDTDVIR